MAQQMIAARHPVPAPTAPPRAAGRARLRRIAPAAAGTAYALAWIAGLLVAPASTDVGSSGTQVLAGLAGHTGAATAQYLLTEGVAAVLLAAVVTVLARALRRAGDRAAGAAVLSTGLVAATISLVQCVLGVELTRVAAPAGDAGAAAALTVWINHLDGAKMLVLAGLAAAGARTARARRAAAVHARVLPRWQAPAGWLLAAALTASGVGYLATGDALSAAAYVSLPLLLIWVAGAGIALRRAGR